MSRALTKDDLLRKRSVQREIPGLGTVTLQSVTVGQIKEAEETSAGNSDTKDHSSFVNYVLSKMISDPPLSMEHVGALSGETLFGLLAEAADVIGVRQEFDEAESDFEGRERLYEAYRRRMAALADSLQTVASQGYTEITKKFEESIDGAMRKTIEAIGKSRPSLDQYHLPALRMPEQLEGVVSRDHIDALFEALRQYHRAEFLLEEFCKFTRERSLLPQGFDISAVFRALYTCSAIGNIHVTSQGQRRYSFRYRNHHSVYNSSDFIVVHRGLRRALLLPADQGGG